MPLLLVTVPLQQLCQVSAGRRTRKRLAEAGTGGGGGGEGWRIWPWLVAILPPHFPAWTWLWLWLQLAAVPAWTSLCLWL